MAKQKSSKLNRRQVARHEKEQQVQQTITWIAIGIISVVVVILAYGVITELFIKARKPIATVGETTITTQAYQSRLRYERLMLESQLFQYQSYLSQFDPEAEETQSFMQQLQLTAANLENQLSDDFANILGKQILDQVIEEILIRQGSQKHNLSVSTEEIDLEIEAMMGFDRAAAQEAAQNLTETEVATDTVSVMTEAEYQELYKNFETNVLQSSNFSEAKFREMIEAGILREKLQEALSTDVSTEADQVEATLFTVDTEAAGQTLQSRINDAGETVETLIAELDGDENEQTYGYTLPWLPTGYLGQQLNLEIEKVAFNTPVGVASSPVLGPDELYYVVYISGHEERALSENLLENSYQEQYQSWLDEQIASLVEYFDWESAVVTD